METQKPKSLEQVISDLGRYPKGAFEFLKQGLDYTVHRMHGEPSPSFKRLVAWMRKHEVDPAELSLRCSMRQLPRDIMQAVNDIGGVEALESRHVSGEQLCWGLRDLALERWGLLARAVLEHWNITTTRDFGEMVFALIDAELLQRTRNDRLEDFDDVYDFEDVFERSYRIPSTVGAA